MRNDGFRGPQRQGGWINFAIQGGIALMGALSGKKGKKQTQAQADADRARQLKIDEASLGLARKQEARADELQGHYRDNFMPREKELVAEAFGNELSPARAEARATADVRDAIATSRDISGRHQRSLGVNPSSGVSQGLERETMLDEARLGATARTQAREGTRDRNFARKVDTLSLGRGLPGTAGNLTSMAQSGTGNIAQLAAMRARSSAALAYDAGAGYGESLAEVGSAAMDAYDLYKARTKPSSTPAGRSGTWG